MRITQLCIWSQKRRRSTRPLKRLSLHGLKYGSKPYQKKQTINPQSSFLQFLKKRFLQKHLTVHPVLQKLALRYEILRC